MIQQKLTEKAPVVQARYQVWIDIYSNDWAWNSPPQSLQSALEEAAQLRRAGWDVKVCPEGYNPGGDWS